MQVKTLGHKRNHKRRKFWIEKNLQTNRWIDSKFEVHNFLFLFLFLSQQPNGPYIRSKIKYEKRKEKENQLGLACLRERKRGWLMSEGMRGELRNCNAYCVYCLLSVSQISISLAHALAPITALSLYIRGLFFSFLFLNKFIYTAL